MRIKLTVIAGPHKGRKFSFSQHDTFLVGRSRHAHFQLPSHDKFVSRLHFLMEVNPPHCRLVDLGSHNGTFVNGEHVLAADLKNGDRIRAGHSTLVIKVLGDASAGSSSGTNTSLLVDVPESLGGFRILGEIRRGDFAVTYLVKHVKDDRQLALAVLPLQGKPPTDQVRAFLHQVRIFRKLQHLAILPLRHLGASRGRLYFAYDYSAGVDAETLVQKQGPLDPARVLKWADLLIDGLRHAHAQKMLHLGIRPANVIVDEKSNQVHFSEFGLAGLFRGSPLSGVNMLQIGEAPFLPPELIFRFDAPGPISDQYALAATLYFLLTAQHAYDFPAEVNGQFSTLLVQKPVPLQTRRPDVPAHLAAALDRALARSPKARFPNLTTFRRALVGKK